MAPRGRVIYLLLESALEMGDGLGAAPESHLLAQVITALAADATLATGNPDLEGDTISNLEAHHRGSNGNHCAGRLVAERKRHAGTQVTIGKLLVIGDIRATDTCSLDSNL